MTTGTLFFGRVACSGLVMLAIGCGQANSSAVGSEPTHETPEKGSQVSGSKDQPAGSSVTAAESAPFFPTLVAQIGGKAKRFKLSSWRATQDPSSARVEFSTGIRALGEEATAGEIYSEVWLLFGIAGSGRMPEAGVYECGPKETRAPGTKWAEIYWSYNHIGTNRRDYSTELSRGPCRISIDAFQPSPGGTFKGTFSGTLDGSVNISAGTFSVVFSTEQDILP